MGNSCIFSLIYLDFLRWTSCHCSALLIIEDAMCTHVSESNRALCTRVLRSSHTGKGHALLVCPLVMGSSRMDVNVLSNVIRVKVHKKRWNCSGRMKHLFIPATQSTIIWFKFVLKSAIWQQLVETREGQNTINVTKRISTISIIPPNVCLFFPWIFLHKPANKFALLVRELRVLVKDLAF